MNTNFVQEQATVRVLNGINTGTNKQARLIPLANNTAIALIKAGFTIFDIGNATTPQLQTTIVTNGAGRSASVKKLLGYFPNAAVSV
jgi:hypothetical protein